MELRIKKATYHIQHSYPWIDEEDVQGIIGNIEREAIKAVGEEVVVSPFNAQDIIEIVCEICKDI